MRPQEEVQFGAFEFLFGTLREDFVRDQKKIFAVILDLRVMPGRKAVVDRERVKIKNRIQKLRFGRGGLFDVDPRHAGAVGDESSEIDRISSFFQSGSLIISEDRQHGPLFYQRPRTRATKEWVS